MKMIWWACTLTAEYCFLLVLQYLVKPSPSFLAMMSWFSLFSFYSYSSLRYSDWAMWVITMKVFFNFLSRPTAPFLKKDWCVWYTERRDLSAKTMKKIVGFKGKLIFDITKPDCPIRKSIDLKKAIKYVFEIQNWPLRK